MAVAFFTSVGTIVVIYSMTSKIQTFASDVMRKTEALQEEKQLTDRLLYQMMPKWVSISFLTLKFNWYQIYVYKICKISSTKDVYKKNWCNSYLRQVLDCPWLGLTLPVPLHFTLSVNVGTFPDPL